MIHRRSWEPGCVESGEPGAHLCAEPGQDSPAPRWGREMTGQGGTAPLSRQEGSPHRHRIPLDPQGPWGSNTLTGSNSAFPLPA